MKGKIVLVPFPFTDLTAAKLRPALVIYEGETDVIVAFISSKIPLELSEADVLIATENPDFKKIGLKVESVIKLDKVATVLTDLIAGELGELDKGLRVVVTRKLKEIFEL
jgi:mRNA interferase MazF